MRKIKDIPQDLLDSYKNYKITSIELARITKFNPASIRRAIERNPREPNPHRNKRKLIAAREAYRATIAHLPVPEIMALAYVSRSTAVRIKAKYNREA